ncbi:MAG: putative maltokinase, partial [Candidatus Latescibacterota bacterium]
DPERYREARVIFRDFEHSNWTWDPEARAYYWHRFYAHQPDLNYDNPQVEKAVFRVIDFWMRLGVDGVRLDAVPYLCEREGTACKNLPETYAALRRLRAHLDGRFANRMLLAEANQWPEDAAAYFGKGDICHMAFHFPLMPRMFMALQMEDSFPLTDILDQTPPIPPNCQWALFLRNHDELTLEMVTDEERDYMYRMYAQDPRMRVNAGIRRRLAPLLDNDQRRMKLLNVLLFCLPGTPVIYYGDELGMGDNYYLGDRNGVRTPMQWSPDRNAGFSRANPQRLYLPAVIDPGYHYEALNVETLEANRTSFLWWTRHLIAMRKRYRAFSRGALEILSPDNHKVFAFVREWEGQRILVAVNLSRYPQVARLGLGRFAGSVPVEIFSRSRFLPVEEGPYVLTFGPYDGYILRFVEQTAAPAAVAAGDGAVLRVAGSWESVLEEAHLQVLEQEVLVPYLAERRWFSGKARTVSRLGVTAAVPVGTGPAQARILLLQVQYTEGMPETYCLPVAHAAGDAALSLLRSRPHAVVCRLVVNGVDGVLYDAMYDAAFCREVLAMIGRRRRSRAGSGELVAYPGRGLGAGLRARLQDLEPSVPDKEQSNTSAVYGDELFLKLFRHPGEGVNPDLEVVRFLTERAGFPQIAAFAGALEYRPRGAAPTTLCILQQYVPNLGDALKPYREGLHSFYEAVLTRRGAGLELPAVPASLLEVAQAGVPNWFQDLATGVPIELTTLLGRRTAEMHLALASRRDDPEFAPEEFTAHWQRAVFQSMQSQAKRVLQLLRSSLSRLPEQVQAEASPLLGLGSRIAEVLRAFNRKRYAALKIRHHGDYHLGQVLYTGKDFVIIDFEGEPARPLGERRLKASSLRDVAGMVRSFHYAAYLALLRDSPLRGEDVPGLEPWGEAWYRLIAGAFLRAYMERVAGCDLIPDDPQDVATVLDSLLLDKAVYELGYELNNRPAWVPIPVRGIKQLLQA